MIPFLFCYAPLGLLLLLIGLVVFAIGLLPKLLAAFDTQPIQRLIYARRSKQ